MRQIHGASTAAVRVTAPVAQPSLSVSITKIAASALSLAALICAAQPAAAQYIQQGSKLVGTGASSPTVTIPGQGQSVSLSASGNTAITGAPNDNNSAGAAWIFTRSGGVWGQQGAKLIGNGAVGGAEQGQSVALSGDGNTAIVGGYFDNGRIGAAWVFTQSGGTWTQQGAKLVGNTSSSEAYEGYAASLSADGNTAIFGGPFDAAQTGAAWIFTRSGTTWTQQAKLVGTGAVLPSFQGASVALSADGNTAIVGGTENNTNVGAVWVYINNGGTWSQQTELLAADAVGQALFGSSVALSADGNVAVIGGPGDDNGIGATWIFVRSGGLRWAEVAKLIGYDNIDSQSVSAASEGTAVAVSSGGNIAAIGAPRDVNGSSSPVGSVFVFNNTGGTWTQQGHLYGNGNAGVPHMGTSAAMSSAGNTIAAGGPFDNTVSSASAGATWVFTRTAPTSSHDFNDDGVSDILWRQNGSGELAMWLMSAGRLSSGADIAPVQSAWSVVGTRDFNGDGYADILWLDTGGDLGVWLMNGFTVASAIGLGNVGTQWQVAGTGDFNGDGIGDILWRNGSTGDVAIWFMNSNGQLSSGADLGIVAMTWSVAGVGDFNGDGRSDILWTDGSGDVGVWLMNGSTVASTIGLGNVGTHWAVAGTGDFNGDGTSDILWRDSSGDLAIWLMLNGQFSSGATLGQVSASWSVAETGDFDGDGKSDILWIDTSGDLGVWLMNGLSVSSQIGLGNVGTTWQVQGKNAD